MTEERHISIKNMPVMLWQKAKGHAMFKCIPVREYFIKALQTQVKKDDKKERRGENGKQIRKIRRVIRKGTH